MGNFRFYRRLHIFPGLSVNLSKSGPSLTVGVRGAHLTMGPSGVRRTVGVPGTGLFYTSTRGRHSGAHSSEHFVPRPPPDRGAELLAKLTDLHRSGLLTDAEYAQKRAALDGPHPPA